MTSHLAWTHNVPAGWAVKPLRLVGRFFKGSGGSKEDVVDEGVPCVRYGELYTTHRNFIERARSCVTQERAADYTPIEYGDVLFAASGETIEEIGKSAVNLLHGARCGGDVVILRPAEPYVARFLGYATDAAPVAAQKSLAGRGSTVKHIYPDELREVVIAVPPLAEQQSIADFLDRETTRLDALVAAKRRLLDLLAEKRKAIIATAVTRGLDPHANLRDSGVPWLGEIPAHWEVMRTGLAGSILMGRQRAPQYEKGAYIRPYLRVANVFDGFIDYSDILEMNFEPEEQATFGLVPGDILLNEGQSRELVGRSAIYRGAPDEYFFQNTLIRFRAGERVIAEFAQAQFTNWLRHGVFQLFSRQSTNIAHLGADRLAQIPMAVPPLSEQRAIVAHIARQTARIDAVRAATERTIALLKERRAALIAAAVTGQLDVGPFA